MEDTIAAIATPLGEAGLAVIRLSGAEAVTIADRVFRPARKETSLAAAPTHTAHYGHVLKAGRVVDVHGPELRDHRGGGNGARTLWDLQIVRLTDRRFLEDRPCTSSDS